MQNTDMNEAEIDQKALFWANFAFWGEHTILLSSVLFVLWVAYLIPVLLMFCVLMLILAGALSVTRLLIEYYNTEVKRVSKEIKVYMLRVISRRNMDTVDDVDTGLVV